MKAQDFPVGDGLVNVKVVFWSGVIVNTFPVDISIAIEAAATRAVLVSE